MEKKIKNIKINEKRKNMNLTYLKYIKSQQEIWKRKLKIKEIKKKLNDK
jgi:hypothetical protein